jgi:hypothetical protein
LDVFGLWCIVLLVALSASVLLEQVLIDLWLCAVMGGNFFGFLVFGVFFGIL